MRRILEADDLRRIWIRAEDSEGSWGNVSADMASDRQFDDWARSRTAQDVEADAQAQGWPEQLRADTYKSLFLLPGGRPWDTQSRVDFCNDLWQRGGLVLLREETEE